MKRTRGRARHATPRVPLLPAILLALGSPAIAAPFTWDANTGVAGAQDGPGTWTATQSAPTNWYDGTNALVPGSADAVTFGAGVGAGAAGTVTLGSAVTVDTLTFAAPGSGNYVLSGTGGNTLTVNTGIQVNHSATINAAILGNAALTVAANRTLTVSGNNTYSGETVVNGVLAAGTGGAGLSANSNLRLTGDGARLNMSGSFTRALGTGPGEFQITGGSGFVGFSANSSSTLTINLGGSGATVQWGSPSFNMGNLLLGVAGPTGDQTVFVNGIDINTAGTRTVVNGKNNLSGSATFGGNISNTASTTGTFEVWNQNGGFTYLTGDSSMQGTLRLTHGVTSIGNGGATGSFDNVSTINLNNAPTMIINRSGSVTFNAAITGGQADRFVAIAGPGTVTFGGNNTYLHGTSVNAGTLILDYTTNNTSKVAAAATLAMGGGTLRLNGHAADPTTQTVGGLVLTAGTSSKIIVDSNGGSGTTLNLGAITTASGATIDFTLPAAGAITTTATNDAFGILGRYATVGQTAFAAVLGGNVVAYTPSDKNDVSTWLDNENISNNGAYTGTLMANTVIGTLRFNAAAAGTVDLGASTLTIGDGAILVTPTVAANAQTITGGSLTSSAADLQFIQYNTGAGLTVNSAISGGIAVSVGGGGVVTLGGANTYSGATNVASGSLIVTGNLGTGALTVAGGSAVQINETGSILNAVSIANNGTITYNRTADITHNKNIIGSGSLIKAGTARVGITTALNYTGGTTVNGGTLAIDGGGSLYGGGAGATGTVVVNNGGTLLFNRSDTFGNAAGNPVGMTFIINAGGMMTNLNTINNIGAVTLNGGTLQSNNGTFHGSFSFRSGVTVGGTSMSTISSVNPTAANAYFNLSNGGVTFNVANATAGTDLMVSAILKNGFAVGGQADDPVSKLTKTGDGTMELTQANTYGGTTSIQGGTLVASNSTGSATGTGAVVVDVGTLAGGGTVSGPVTVSSTGRLAPSGTSLKTGALTLNDASQLDFDLGTASDTIVVTGALTLDGVLNVNPVAGFAATNYQLFSYTGALTNNTLEISGGWMTATVDTSQAGKVFLNVTAVPEPASAGLLAMAGAGLLMRRRRAGK